MAERRPQRSSATGRITLLGVCAWLLWLALTKLGLLAGGGTSGVMAGGGAKPGDTDSRASDVTMAAAKADESGRVAPTPKPVPVAQPANAAPTAPASRGTTTKPAPEPSAAPTHTPEPVAAPTPPPDTDIVVRVISTVDDAPLALRQVVLLTRGGTVLRRVMTGAAGTAALVVPAGHRDAWSAGTLAVTLAEPAPPARVAVAQTEARPATITLRAAPRRELEVVLLASDGSVLRDPGSVSVHAATATGAADADAAAITSTATLVNGAAVIGGLPGGERVSIRINATRAGGVQLEIADEALVPAAGDVRTRHDVRLAPGNAAIRGRAVFDDRTPIRNSTVQFAVFRSRHDTPLVTRLAVATDADGAFNVSVEPGHEVLLEARLHPQLPGDDQTPVVFTTATLSAAWPWTLGNVVFERDAEVVSGRVIAADGTPVRGATVRAHPLTAGRRILVARTQDDGRFSLWGPASTAPCRVVALTDDTAGRHEATVAAGGGPLTLTLAPAGHISGRVEAAEGILARRAEISLHWEDSAAPAIETRGVMRDGAFELPVVPAGTWFVRVQTAGAAPQTIGPLTVPPGGAADDARLARIMLQRAR